MVLNYIHVAKVTLGLAGGGAAANLYRQSLRTFALSFLSYEAVQQLKCLARAQRPGRSGLPTAKPSVIGLPLTSTHYAFYCRGSTLTLF